MTKPKVWRPSPFLTLCRLCGERVSVPCTSFIDLKRPQQKPVPAWPRYDPVELPPDAFADNIVEPPDRGRLPPKPESLPGVRSSLGWSKDI